MSKKITFDYWKHLYSSRMEGMVSSEIRDLLSLSARPDIISFAGGLPEVRALNHQKLERYIKRTLRTDAEISLQYGDSTGYYPLRTRLNIIGIPIDKDGIIVSEVERKLKELSGKKIGVKFIYVVPNFSNPSGVTINLKRRKKLLDLARKHNTIIIEDNPYGMLRYEGKAIKTIKELDSKGDNRNVIYISTLSKLFAPGFRIGWIVAPHLILEKLTLGVQSAVLCNSTFSQRIAYEYFSDPSWKNNITEFIKIYKNRRDTMFSALEENLSGIATWSKPKGGFFIWLKVPDFLNTKEILADAVRNKVAFVPGTGFYADGRGKDSARIAFCTESKENIEKGIKILAKIIKDKIRLYKSFK